MILLVAAWFIYLSKLIELRISNVGSLLFVNYSSIMLILTLIFQRFRKCPVEEYERTFLAQIFFDTFKSTLYGHQNLL